MKFYGSVLFSFLRANRFFFSFFKCSILLTLSIEDFGILLSANKSFLYIISITGQNFPYPIFTFGSEYVNSLIEES